MNNLDNKVLDTTGLDPETIERERLKGYLQVANMFKGEPSDVSEGNQSLYLANPFAEIANNKVTRDALIAQALGANQFIEDNNAESSGLDYARDIGLSTGQALYNMLGSTISTGLGLASDELGAAYAQEIDKGSQYLDSLKSDALQQRKRAYQAKRLIDDAIFEKQYQEDIAKGDSKVRAGLRKMGKQAMSAITHSSDSTALMAEGISQIGASVGATIALSGGIGAIAKGMETLGGANLASKALQAGKWELSNMALEGSAASQEARASVMNLSHETLMNNSPSYANLYKANLEMGMSSEEAEYNAKASIASDVANNAGAASALLAGVTSKLTKGLDTPNISNITPKSFAVNTLGNTLEEGIQEGGSQLGINVATKALANKDQDITEGVAESSALGALYGGPGASVTMAPSATIQGLKGIKNKFSRDTSKAVSEPKENITSLGAISTKVDDILINNDQNKLEKNIQEKTKVEEAFKLTDQEKSEYGVESNNRVALISTVVDTLLNNKDLDESQKTDLANRFINLFQPIENVLDLDEKNFTEEQAQQVQAIIGVTSKLAQDPTIKKAFEQIAQLKASQQTASSNDGILAMEYIAENAPDKLNVKEAEKALTSGSLDETTTKKLELALAFAKSNEYVNKFKVADTPEVSTTKKGKSANEVASQLFTNTSTSSLDNSKGYISANQFISNIQRALSKGDKNLADRNISTFGNVVQTHTNYLNALEQSKKTGEKVEYDSYRPFDRQWQKLSVKYTSENFLNRIKAENKALNDVYQKASEAVSSISTKAVQQQQVQEVQTSVEQPLVQESVQKQPVQVSKTPKTTEVKSESVKQEVKKTEVSKPVESVRETKSKVDELLKQAVQSKSKEQARKESKEVIEQLNKSEPKKEIKQTISEEDRKKFETNRGKYKVHKDGFNVSTKGSDLGRRFSAFNAKLSDGRSIEEHYQVDIKGYKSIEEGKGKASKKTPLNKLWEAYLNLWRQWAELNPSLMQRLRVEAEKHGNALFDPFAKTGNNQARALSVLLNEGYGLSETKEVSKPKTENEILNEAFKKDLNKVSKSEPVKQEQKIEQPKENIESIVSMEQKKETEAYNAVVSSVQKKMDENGWVNIKDLSDTELDYLNKFGIETINELNEEGEVENYIDAAGLFKLDSEPLLSKVNETTEKFLSNNFNIRTTLIANSNSPLRAIKELLSGSDDNIKTKLKAWLGKDSKVNKISKNKRKNLNDLLKSKGLVNELVKGINSKVESFVKENGNRAKTNYNRDNLYKILNEKNQLDPFITEVVALATIQALNRLTGAKNQTVNISELLDKLGIQKQQYLGSLEELAQGVSKDILIDNINSLVTNYLGLSTKKDVLPSNSSYVLTSVITEAVGYLIDNNYINVKEVELFTLEDINDALSNKQSFTKKVTLFTPTNKLEETSVSKIGDLISILMGATEHESLFFDDSYPEISNTVLRSDNIPTTKKQKESLKEEAHRNYYINDSLADVFNSFGMDGLARFIYDIESEIDEEAYNVKDLESVKGRKLVVKGGFETAMESIQEAKDYAEATGKSLRDVTLHFGSAITIVNRLQETDSFGYRASKIFRELVSPTRSVFNFNDENSEAVDDYKRAILQKFGAKVEKYASKQEVANAFEDLTNRIRNTESFMNVIPNIEDNDGKFVLTNDFLEGLVEDFDSLGLDRTSASLHAFFDLARLEMTPIADRANFETFISLEADGKNNGTVMGRLLFGAGVITSEFVSILNSGGVYFGVKMPFADIMKDPEFVDNYIRVGSHGGWRNVIKKAYSGDLYDQIKFRAFATLLQDFAGNKVKGFDIHTVEDIRDIPQDSIIRGLVKYPVVATGYSGTGSAVANTYTSDIMKSVYSRLTNTLKNLNNGYDSIPEAMFPEVPKELAVEYHKQFVLAINLLMGDPSIFGMAKDVNNNLLVPSNFSGSLTWRFDSYDEIKNFSPKYSLKTFTFNLKNIVGDPFYEGVNKALGEDTRDSLETYQRITNFASEVYSIIYDHLVNKYLTEREKAYGIPRESGLSKTELKNIKDQIKELGGYPLIESKEFNFLSAKFSTKVKSTDNIGKVRLAKGKSLTIYPMTASPSSIGVGAVADSVLGNGDGSAMNNLKSPQDSGKVFDGLEMSAGTAKEKGIDANKAMLMAGLNNNPLKDALPMADNLLNVFSVLSFIEALDTTDNKLTLGRALGLSKKDSQDLSAIRAEYAVLVGSLKRLAISHEARSNLFKTVPMSFENMVGKNNPYITSEDKIITLDPNEAPEVNALKAKEEQKLVIDLINTNLDEEIKRVRQEWNDKEKGNKSITTTINIGTLVKDTRKASVKETTVSNIMPLIIKNIDSSLAKLLKPVLDGISKLDTKVVLGTKEEVIKYCAENDLPIHDISKVRGFYNENSNILFILKDSSNDYSAEEIEYRAAITALHELIHALTARNISLGIRMMGGPSITAAVNRLEKLLKIFLEQDFSKVEGNEKIIPIQNRIRSFLENPNGNSIDNKSLAIKEFVAYCLSHNKETINALQAIDKKSTSKLVSIIRSTKAVIKRLLGLKDSPKIDNFFETLVWNTAVLGQNQSNQGVLFQEDLYLKEDTLSQELSDSINLHLGDQLKAIYEKRFSKFSDIYKQRLAVSLAKMDTLGKELSVLALSKGFTMNGDQWSNFKTITSIFAIEGLINSNVMSLLYETYSEAIKQLSIEDFMKNPDNPDNADIEQATKKYDLIIGRTNDVKLGQFSTNLPLFLGLALTNPELRNILAKKKIQEKNYKGNGTLNDKLDGYANMLFDNMSRRYSKIDKYADNSQAVLDALAMHIFNQRNEREFQILSSVQGVISVPRKINNHVADVLSEVAFKVQSTGSKLKYDSKSATGYYSGYALEILGALGNKQNAERMAEEIIKKLNLNNAPPMLVSLISELVGRTKSSENIYAQLKKTKAFIQRARSIWKDRTPKEIKNKFSRELSEEEWSHLYKSLGKTDLQSLLSLGWNNVVELFGNKASLNKQIRTLEDKINNLDPNNSQLIIKKSKQLAEFMITGDPGNHLLRNARAIANLVGYKVLVTPTEELIKAIDQLTSLYAIEKLDVKEVNTMNNLLKNSKDNEALKFITYFLRERQAVENSKLTSRSKFNAFKGYVPSTTRNGYNLIVAEDKKEGDLNELGYTKIKSYPFKDLDSLGRLSYFFSITPQRGAFNQGALQTIRITSNGVDASTGYTNGLVAGRIVSKHLLENYENNSGSFDTPYSESYMPVYDEKGNLRALERSIDPEMLKILQGSTNLADMLGVWAGRQEEERAAHIYNEESVKMLSDMYVKASEEDKKQFINIFDKKQTSKTIQDAVSIMSPELRVRLETEFGTDTCYVRKDLVRQVIGERSASIADIWTGNTNLSPKTQKEIRRIMKLFMGNKAFTKLVNAENKLFQISSSTRDFIVIRSIAVPAINIASNVLSLMIRGVPIWVIAKQIPKKVHEIESYLRREQALVRLKMELAAYPSGSREYQKIQARINSIAEANKYMSISPVLEAGEFSTIADIAITENDIDIIEGRWGEYIDQKVDELPKELRTTGKYLAISKDTSLHKGLQKMVQYGDFIAKSIYYEHLKETGRNTFTNMPLTEKEILNKVAEEFVDYDRLPGRTRAYMENLGLLWFFNYSLRSTKIAIDMLRENPLYVLLATMHPLTLPFGTVGFSVTDNIFSKLFEGTLGFSVGMLDMPLQALKMHPTAVLTGLDDVL